MSLFHRIKVKHDFIVYLFLLVGSITLQWSRRIEHRNTLSAPSTPSSDSEAPTPKDGPPKFLFGFSTGHAGSTTVDQTLRMSDCVWSHSLSGEFEQVVQGERGWEFRPDESDSCNITQTRLVPFLDEKRQRQEEQRSTYVDMGHYHNRLSHLECFARLWHSNVGFLRIRRNRYHIAQSFAKQFDTPCRVGDHAHVRTNRTRVRVPRFSYCPHSLEQNGPVVLAVPNNNVWNEMSRFQKFLWYADDMEMRWYNLKRQYQAAKENHHSPSFYEITWSDSDDLSAGLARFLYHDMACTGSNNNVGQEYLSFRAMNAKQHGERKLVNCTQQIHEDLDYRAKMRFTPEQQQVLFQNYPQRLLGCLETSESLVKVLSALLDHDDSRHWILP